MAEMKRYYSDMGGLPGQTELLSSKAVFKTAYAVIPKTVMSDIVTSVLPHWTGTRAWIIARPMTGFSETFAQYIVEVQPGGGSDRPEPDARAEAAIFVVDGEMTVEFEGVQHGLREGFLCLPACRLPLAASQFGQGARQVPLGPQGVSGG